jgi:hypothetical protein
MPDIRQRLATLVMDPAGLGPDEFRATIARRSRSGPASPRTAGIQLER